MSGFDKADNNLSTGAPVTHIGPETGNTANATDGGESGAGTNEEGSPPEASLGQTAAKAKIREPEPASFQPKAGARNADLSGGPVSSEETRNVADGKDPRGH